MVQSKGSPLCPYYKKENNRISVLGTTGLINYSGMVEIRTECSYCKKPFDTDIQISISYKTREALSVNVGDKSSII